MTTITLEQIIADLDKKVQEIQDDADAIHHLDEVLEKIIQERDLNISTTIGYIKESIKETQEQEETPFSENLKRAIDTRNLTGESADREIQKRLFKIQEKIRIFNSSLTFLQQYIDEVKINTYKRKIEFIESSILDYL